MRALATDVIVVQVAASQEGTFSYCGRSGGAALVVRAQVSVVNSHMTKVCSLPLSAKCSDDSWASAAVKSLHNTTRFSRACQAPASWYPDKDCSVHLGTSVRTTTRKNALNWPGREKRPKPTTWPTQPAQYPLGLSTKLCDRSGTSPLTQPHGMERGHPYRDP
jgi:hypothetical protein